MKPELRIPCQVTFCLVHCITRVGVVVLRGSGAKCLTRNPGVLDSSCTGSSGFFRFGVLGQDTSEPKSSTGETQKRHESCKLSP